MKKLCCLLACLAALMLCAALGEGWQFWERADGTIVMTNGEVEGGEVITSLSLGRGETRLIEVEGTYWSEFRTNRYYIVRVNEEGVLTTHDAGEARISVYYDDNKYVNLAVKVYKNPTKLEIEKTSMELQIGESFKLRYRFNKNAFSSLRWYSTDEEVAQVDRHGTVTGVAPGECQVYLETENGLSVKCDVTVPLPEPAQVVTEKYAEGYACEETQLVYELKGGWQETAAFASSDESVLTVDETGMVSCLKAGEAVITITAQRGGSAEVYFTVLPAASGVVPETGVYYLFTGGSVKLNAGTQGGSGNYTAECPDGEIAVVDEDMVLHALSAGVSAVRFTAPGGARAESLLIVRDKPESLGLDLPADIMAVGESQTVSLSADALPGASLSLYSTAPKVFTVDGKGRISALTRGEGELVAEVGGLTLKRAVTVEKLAAGLEFDEEELTAGVGDSIRLSARHIDGAGEIGYSCPAAGVSIDGDTLTALEPGEYTVSARLISGSGAEMKVSVLPAATRLTPGVTRAAIGEGDTLEIPVVFDEGGYSILAWTSGDASLFDVSDGRVTALGAQGKSWAEASTSLGISAKVELEALPAPEEFTLGYTQVSQKSIFTDYLRLKAGQSAPFDPVFSQPYTHITYTVTAFDPDVARVEDGQIVAVKAGIARIRVETYNGLSREIMVEVNNK
ncbi:MAG: Ig-like domain-containing protein [Clostridia bacterium]|nr:Ig-like domain-containing protein [Clostridia bacterium]